MYGMSFNIEGGHHKAVSAWAEPGAIRYKRWDGNRVNNDPIPIAIAFVP
jgi:hypothetical protein